MPDATPMPDPTWQAQEAALAAPAAAPLLRVLREPPPMALPPDFAAALARRVADRPSAHVEGALALVALLLLGLAAAVALHLQPGLPAVAADLLGAGDGWLPVVALALVASRALAAWSPQRPDRSAA